MLPCYLSKMKINVVTGNSFKFQFNGWGDKFYPYNKVRKIPLLIAKKLNIECIKSKLILEGGGVSFDGDGTAITLSLIHI